MPNPIAELSTIASKAELAATGSVHSRLLADANEGLRALVTGVKELTGPASVEAQKVEALLKAAPTGIINRFSLGDGLIGYQTEVRGGLSGQMSIVGQDKFGKDIPLAHIYRTVDGNSPLSGIIFSDGTKAYLTPNLSIIELANGQRAVLAHNASFSTYSLQKGDSRAISTWALNDSPSKPLWSVDFSKEGILARPSQPDKAVYRFAGDTNTAGLTMELRKSDGFAAQGLFPQIFPNGFTSTNIDKPLFHGARVTGSAESTNLGLMALRTLDSQRPPLISITLAKDGPPIVTLETLSPAKAGKTSFGALPKISHFDPESGFLKVLD